jgi:hypothetical protein
MNQNANFTEGIHSESNPESVEYFGFSFSSITGPDSIPPPPLEQLNAIVGTRKNSNFTYIPSRTYNLLSLFSSLLYSWYDSISSAQKIIASLKNKKLPFSCMPSVIVNTNANYITSN